MMQFLSILATISMTDLLEDEFGDIVGKARHGLDLSLSGLGAQANIGEDDLQSFEMYQRTPSRQESDRIADVLDLDSACLWAAAREAWSPESVSLEHCDTRLRTVSYAPMRITQYVVGDIKTGHALVVDPGAEPELILNVLAEEHWAAVAILITHADADHVGALPVVHQELDVPIWIHPEERTRLPDISGLEIRAFEDHMRFDAGSFEIEARHTPGHSPGHTSLVLRDLVLVGDTMFAGSIGRTSMGSPHYVDHLATVRRELLELSGSTRLFPGHGPPTTVAEERVHNPFFAEGMA